MGSPECSGLHRTQVSMKSVIIFLSLVAISLSQSSGGTCSYNCDGWPYEQCKMESRFASATCINPFTSRSSSQIFSNYPECANIPSGCQRCDDVCSSRDGNKDKLDYRKNSPSRGSQQTQGSPLTQHRPSSSAQHRPSSSKDCDYQCKPNGGCTATFGLASGSCFPADFGGS